MAGIYNSRFSGAEIDMAVENALNFDPVQNGWERLASGVTYPININDLVATGNYIMDYFINGPKAAEDISPINVSIIEIDGVLTQAIPILDNVHYRSFDETINGYPDEWYTKKTSNYIYIEEVPESPEPNGLLISKDDEGNYMLNIYDVDKKKFVPVSTPDVMLGKVYDTEGRETDFFKYADEIYQQITGSSIGLQWTAVDNTDVFGYKISCIKYVNSNPNEYIVTFKDSSKVVYHVDGTDYSYDIGTVLVNPQIITYEDGENIGIIYVYDVGDSKIYTSVNKCESWSVSELAEFDMYFDTAGMYIRMESPVTYGYQTHNIFDSDKNDVYQHYFYVKFTYDASTYFAKCTIDAAGQFILADTNLTTYDEYSTAIMSTQGRLFTTSDHMNPGTSNTEPVYIEFVEDEIKSTIDDSLSNYFYIASAKEYTQKSNGAWYLKPVVIVNVKDVTNNAYNITTKHYLTLDDEVFVRFSNFIDVLGTYVGYGITDAGKIVQLTIEVDTENLIIEVSMKEVASVDLEYNADAIIYNIQSVQIFRHKDIYPVTTEILISNNGDDILDIANEHFTNQSIHFSTRDRASLLLRETKNSANSKIYNLKVENEKYVDQKIVETDKKLAEIENDIELQSIRLDEHIENDELHATKEKQEYWSNKAEPDHTHFNDGRVEVDASKIVSGVIEMARLPKGAKERITKVQSIAEMLALTIDDVQDGDRVAVKHSEATDSTPETWELYEVIDETKLGTMDAFLEGSAGSSTYIDWENVEQKPTTVEGYGITNAYNKTDTEKIIDEKINAESEKLNKTYTEYDLKGMYETIHDTEDSIKKIESEIDNAIAISEEVNAQRIDYNELLARVDAMSEDMAEMEAVVDSLLETYS